MKKTIIIIGLILVLFLIPIVSSENNQYEVNISNYPYFFKNGFETDFIIGDSINPDDSVSLTGIVNTLSELGNCSVIPEDSCIHPIFGGPIAAKQASERTSLYDKNVLLVGGPCANSVTAQIMGLNESWPECATGFKEGEAKIRLYGKYNRTFLVVAGYSAQDTRNAAEILINYQDYDLSSEIEVVVTVEEPDKDSSEYVCTSNYYNCGDFSTHAEAQAVFEACGASTDIHKLDRDSDLVACESLP